MSNIIIIKYSCSVTCVFEIVLDVIIFLGYYKCYNYGLLHTTLCVYAHICGGRG